MVYHANQLTPRQAEVLRLRVGGENIKAIAYGLNLSPKTVEYHWAKVQERTGLRDVALLTQWAIRNGVAGWAVPRPPNSF